MATILKFRVRTTRRRITGVGARQPRSAEIVIFPGVRYERWDDGQGRSKTRRRVKRDMLTIGE